MRECDRLIERIEILYVDYLEMKVKREKFMLAASKVSAGQNNKYNTQRRRVKNKWNG